MPDPWGQLGENATQCELLGYPPGTASEKITMETELICQFTLMIIHQSIVGDHDKWFRSSQRINYSA
jgi:hypothetical protein